MDKVVSFKTSHEVYNKLKALNKTFRELIEPLVIDRLEQSEHIENKRNEVKYTGSIPSCFNCKYQNLCLVIDKHLHLRGDK